MKILQLCPKIPYPPRDGGSIAMFNLAKGFSSLGHEVTILAMNTPKHFQKTTPKFNNLKIELIPVNVNTRINPFKALLNLLFKRTPYIAERFISSNYKKALVNLLTQKQFDIIQLEGLYVASYIPLIKKTSPSRIAFRAHNIEHKIWQRSLLNRKGIIKRYLQNMTKRLERLEKSIINQYDLLIPITQRDLEQYTSFGNVKPAYVSPTGFELPENSATLKPALNDSLFFIGALDWFPNQEGLLWFMKEVWSDVNKKNPEIKLYIAGRNAPNDLKEKFKYPNTIFLGEIDNAHSFMESKGIMIVPLFSGSGMRVKIIEGMSLGKAIITSSIGAEGINITHNENIIIANTPEEYIISINILLNNNELFNKISRNAKIFIAENYDNKKISSSLVEFYKSHLR